MNNYKNIKNKFNMKTFKTLFLAIAILFAYSINAQVSVTTDGSSADGSAMLEVKSTEKGFLPPRMKESQRNDISDPATGLIIYQTDGTAGLYQYNGTAWAVIGGSSSASTHYVGELYGGGVVFWVDETGEHGLIVSMVDVSTATAWSNITSALDGTNDWDGASNTTAIIGQTGHTSSAAKYCDDYTNADYGTGVFSDWYLPSRTELKLVWNNLYEIHKAIISDGNSSTKPLQPEVYWSSTEVVPFNAYTILFTSGSISSLSKINSRMARAIRAF
jgi:hypothetical protein